MKNWPLILLSGLAFGFTGQASGTESQCPNTWYELSLPKNSKQCRFFGVKKPSTLSFFVVNKPENVIEFFSANENAVRSDFLQQFTQITLSKPGFNIFIYPDGAGTQVNIRAEAN